MSWIFDVCFGTVDEERKFSTFTETNGSWNGGDESSTLFRSNKERIQTVESQITLVNRANRQQITSRPVDLHDANYEPPEFPKTAEQRDFLRTVLKVNFIFNALAETEMEQLISAMQREDVAKGTLVIQQGDVGDYYYIVEAGEIEYILDGDKSVGSAKEGGSFGELALLYDAPRAVSCKATRSTTLWKVDQKSFRTLLARHTKDRDDDIKKLIDSISLFKHLDENAKARFINAMTQVVWNADDRIVQKGSIGNVFYIIQEGQVRVHDIGLGDSKFEEQTLGKGSWFGERALVTGEKRAANVTALTEVKTLAMDSETFEKTIGPMKTFLEFEMRKQFLQSIPIFANSDVTEPELGLLAGLMTEVCYRKGEKLAVAGKPYEMYLWIIRHGLLAVYNTDGGDIFQLKNGDYFGDKSIVADPEHVGSHNAVAEVPLTTWVLARSDIESVLSDIGRLGQAVKLQHDIVDRDIPLSNLERMRILGRGGFGTVWMVKTKGKDGEAKAYALKELSKRRLLDANQDKGIIREKQLLGSLKHPFILGLVCSYQDESNLYLLLPIIPGGELFSVLHNQKMKDRGLSNNAAAFYAAGIVEGLGYFHQRLIAYRDLKLENVLIDADGYPVIVDLGFAKIVVDKTYTLCGTPEYLAPEIIMSKGHDKAADYWSLGVLVYELLVGVSPFYVRGSKQLDMFKRIVLGQYTIPSYVGNDAADLIKKGLLVRKASERLGNLSKGYLDIKNHTWFPKSGVVPSSVLNKKLEAPWKPKVTNPFDSSNFDEYADDAGIDYEKRLTPEEQAIFEIF